MSPRNPRQTQPLLRGTIAVMALALLSGACSPTIEESTDDTGYSKTVERGPVTLVLRLDHLDITIADRIHLDLEVTASEDYEVTLPRFGDKLELDIIVVDNSVRS